MSEILARYNAIADGFSARIDAVPTDAWDNDAPCEGWKARDVVLHVVRNQLGFAGGAAPEDIPDDDLVVRWAEARAGIAALLSDPERAAAEMQSPMGPLQAQDLVGRFICTDTLVHTWDLARATGLDETLDETAVAGAYGGMKPMDEMLRRPGFFGDKTEAPEGCSLQTELLCFLGRPV